MRIFLILCFFSFAALGQGCDSMFVKVKSVKYNDYMNYHNCEDASVENERVWIKQMKPVVIPITR